MRMTLLGDWLLTVERAVVYLPAATAVVADLHLGYAEARQQGGEAIPTVSVETILAPLGRVCKAHQVERLLIAGDLFESGSRENLVAGLLLWLKAAGIELVAVIPGNHDRGLHSVTGLPIHQGAYRLGSWHIVHGDAPLPDGPVVQGHLHPCLRLPGLAGAAPCYLWSDRHLILPAYSPEASGGGVLGRQEWQDYHCHVIAGERLLDFGNLGLLRRRIRGR
jgi:uncharacterized protein